MQQRRVRQVRLVRQPAGPGGLRPVARHLLHLLDLLRGGGTGSHGGPRLHPDLFRACAGDHARLPAAGQDGAPRQAPERYLDRRLPRLALRQEPRRRRQRHVVRDGRRAALHRAAAAGRVLDLQHHRRADTVLLLLPEFGCPTPAVYRAYDAAPRPLQEPRVRAAAESTDARDLFNDLAAAAAMITWLVVEKLLAKHATTLGAASGAVAICSIVLKPW